jgi:hypothetical protein
MNVPAPTPVNVTLTITSDGKGGLQCVWSGSIYCDSQGNFTLTNIKGVIQTTMTISTSLQVSFYTPASQSMWLGPTSSGPPRGPYSGNEFTAPTFVNNSSAVLQWTDQNSDGLPYQYILLLWLVNAQNPNGTTIKVDPRIVNRGNSK